MRKFLFIFIALLFIASNSFALELPDKIQNWHAVNSKIVPLIASNQDLGQIVYKSYLRKKPLGNLEIILTQGKGTGELYIPENVRDSSELFNKSSGYEIINISGLSAILEKNENLPLALAVKVDNNITLTIETHALNESELIKFAGDLLSNSIK